MFLVPCECGVFFAGSTGYLVSRMPGKTCGLVAEPRIITSSTPHVFKHLTQIVHISLSSHTVEHTVRTHLFIYIPQKCML